MSLQYIPFQPLYFGELPDDCCRPTPTGTCKDVGGVGGIYANLAQYTDVTQFQLVLGLCGDAEQLVTNPNFDSSQGDQELSNPEFDGTTANWETYTSEGVLGFAVVFEGGQWVAGLSYVSSGTAYLYQPVTEGAYYVEVEVTQFDSNGVLEILNLNGDNIAATGVGTLSGVIYAGSEYGIALNVKTDGSSHKIASVKAYPIDVTPWQTQGSVSVQDGIVTMIGTPQSSITQSGLNANTTYLVELNVLSLGDNGLASVALGLSESASQVITETGVQQFILTTDASPFIGLIVSGGGSLEVEYIQIYEWFDSDDITVDIIPYGSTDPIVTLGAESKYISVDSLTVSIDWDTILIDDELIPEGLYYIRVTDCDGSISSQPIDLKTSHTCTFALRACMDNDALQFDFESFSPFIRLKASFVQPSYTNPDRLLFTDTRDHATNAFSVVKKVKVFEADDVPEYVLDFLGTLSAYSTIWLGNQQYVVDNESMKPDPNEEFTSWGRAEIEFRMVNYPLRSVRCASEVKDCSPPPNCWQWNDESNIDWNDPEECILLNN